MCVILWGQINIASMKFIVRRTLTLVASTQFLLEVQPHTKHYKINDSITCNLVLELKYGSSIDVFPMDKVSNVEFTEVSR